MAKTDYNGFNRNNFLRDSLNMSYKDVAERYGISEYAAKKNFQDLTGTNKSKYRAILRKEAAEMYKNSSSNSNSFSQRDLADMVGISKGSLRYELRKDKTSTKKSDKVIDSKSTLIDSRNIFRKAYDGLSRSARYVAAGITIAAGLAVSAGGCASYFYPTEINPRPVKDNPVFTITSDSDMDPRATTHTEGGTVYVGKKAKPANIDADKLYTNSNPVAVVAAIPSNTSLPGVIISPTNLETKVNFSNSVALNADTNATPSISRIVISTTQKNVLGGAGIDSSQNYINAAPTNLPSAPTNPLPTVVVSSNNIPAVSSNNVASVSSNDVSAVLSSTNDNQTAIVPTNSSSSKLVVLYAQGGNLGANGGAVLAGEKYFAGAEGLFGEDNGAGVFVGRLGDYVDWQLSGEKAGDYADGVLGFRTGFADSAFLQSIIVNGYAGDINGADVELLKTLYTSKNGKFNLDAFLGAYTYSSDEKSSSGVSGGLQADVQLIDKILLSARLEGLSDKEALDSNYRAIVGLNITRFWPGESKLSGVIAQNPMIPHKSLNEFSRGLLKRSEESPIEPVNPITPITSNPSYSGNNNSTPNNPPVNPPQPPTPPPVVNPPETDGDGHQDGGNNNPPVVNPPVVNPPVVNPPETDGDGHQDGGNSGSIQVLNLPAESDGSGQQSGGN